MCRNKRFTIAPSHGVEIGNGWLEGPRLNEGRNKESESNTMKSDIQNGKKS